MEKVYYNKLIKSNQANSDLNSSNTKREFLEKHLEDVKRQILSDFDEGLVNFKFMELYESDTKSYPVWESSVNTLVNIY